DVQRARDKLYLSDAGVPLTTQSGSAAWNQSEYLAKLWAGMSLTIPGITWIYNGDEIGMFGTKRDNPAADGAGHEDRWYRQPMKWSKELLDSSNNCRYIMGFNNYYMEWDDLNKQLDGVQEQRNDPNSIFNVYKSIIKIRKENPVLARGKVVSHTEGGNVVCYSVTDGTSEILVYVNAATEAAEATYALPAEATLLYGAGLSGKSVPATSIQIYKVK
ncbi:MAG: hypothetical protein K2K12_05470, partial [Clostridia bacterium]|nr:hypothetical protein [Clostridia bacterium]